MPKQPKTKIILRRIVSTETDKSIKGVLQIVSCKNEDEILFECDTLELRWNNNLRSKSCVRTGKYGIGKRKRSRFLPTYKKRYGHDGIYGLNDVDGRSHILIHTGNKPEHTKGCILPGTDEGKKDFIHRSGDAYDKLYKAIEEHKPDQIVIQDCVRVIAYASFNRK